MSDTTRTDANIVGKELHSDFAPEELVDANFARQLERELAAEKQRAEYWEQEALRYCQNSDYWRERADGARQAAIAECATVAANGKFKAVTHVNGVYSTGKFPIKHRELIVADIERLSTLPPTHQVVPVEVYNALQNWSGNEPSQSVLARAVDKWLEAARKA